MNASVFAGTPGVDEPIRYKDDAKQIFMQDFEKASKNFTEKKLNPDEKAYDLSPENKNKRPTTLFTWDAKPVDKIEKVTYYKRQSGDKRTDSVFDLSSSSIGSNTNIYDGSSQWKVAGVRDTLMELFDGVVKTDAKWPEDSILNYDKFFIMDHTDASQHGKDIGGKDYGLDRFGEEGGSQYFQYTSAKGNGVSGFTDDGKYVAEYRRNLFIRNIPIEPNSSYRVTVFVKPTTVAKQSGYSPRIGLDLMRGYFHSEKPFLVNNLNDAKTFDDKTNYTDLEDGKWNKITLMSYYCNDEVGNASPYIKGYYWLNDWAWQVKANKADSTVNKASGDTTMIFRAIQQPAKYFVRLAFRGDSVQYDVDNLSLTKSWIGGVEHCEDMIRVDFGYKTNMGDLAQAALEKNKIAAVELPGEYFDVWALWEGEWWQIPINSAEYQGDGYMYMWTKENEVTGLPYSFEGADSVLVSFRNPKDRDDLKLKYTGDLYPNGMDEEWQNDKEKRLVFDFHNEISALNPTITVSPKTKKAVKSLKDLPPVLQKEAYEDGTFGLDPNLKEMTFKFSRNLVSDNKGIASKLTKVVLRKSGFEEFWTIKEYGDITDGTTTIVRPAGGAALSGDYVLSFEQVTHDVNADPSATNLDDYYGETHNFDLHFGDFDANAESVVVSQSDWRSEITQEGAWDRPTPPSLYTYDSKDGFFQGTGENFSTYTKNGLYKMKDGEENGYGNALMYITSYDKTKKIWGTLYTVETLKAGNYVLKFPAFGWGTNDTETKVYVYAKPDAMEYDKLTAATKTEIGSFKPTSNTSWSGNNDEKSWTNDVGNKVVMCEYKFTIPANGDYVIEWATINNNGGQTYYGFALGNYTVKTAGDLSFIPVNNVNVAIKAAADKIASVTEAKYQGADYNNLVSTKREADGFIAAKKASKVNLPSEYAAEVKTINDAINTLKLHMDTVDLFDKKVADVENKIALYAEKDSLKDYANLPELTALKAIKTAYANYAYSSKKTSEITADIKVMDDAIKTLEARQDLNFSFPLAKAYAKLYADSAAKVLDAAVAKTISDALAHAQAFDSISCTYEQLSAEMLALSDAVLTAFYKDEIVNNTTRRIKELAAIAVAQGGSLANLITDNAKLAEVIERVEKIEFDDDELAEILKNAIKIAIYDKISKGESVENINLTPFIKNYYLYTTVRDIVERMDYQQPKNSGDLNKRAGFAQIQHTRHQYNNNGNMPIWIMIQEQEFSDLYPGWTVKAQPKNNGGNRMVTPDDDKYSRLSNNERVFDGQLAMDWNSQAILKTEVTGLPAGIYTLSYDLSNSGGNDTKLAVKADDKSYEGKGVNNVKNIEVLMQKMAIELTLTSGNGWSTADNFKLIYNGKSSDPWFQQYYPTLLQNAISELDNKITVVDAAVAEGAAVEYITLGGIKVDAPVEGQIMLRKATENGTVVVNKVLSK